MDKKLPKKLHNVPKLQQELKRRPEAYWNSRGHKMAIELFHEMARRVPAYKDFLKQQKFDPQTVKNIRDFKKIPLIDKDNYLRKYPREALCWDGDFAGQDWVVSTTSGSTGVPYYFPRSDLQDDQYALSAELYLRENFQIQDRTTLYIDAFAMGAWIGGLFTYQAVKKVAEKGYKITIITPGLHKQEVINSVKNLGPDFDQVIIGCYPPMMKDVIDLGNEQGVKWKDFNLGLVFSAEGFSEEFRDHILESAGLKDPYRSSLNHYGTVDLGTMSHETPLTTLVRRQARDHHDLSKKLFGDTRKQPTVTQYLPELFYFEASQGRVVCSSFSGLPLVRYDLKDNGGTLSRRQVNTAFRKSGLNLADELNKAGIARSVWNLPIVYLFERSDFSVTFLGGTIYPEEIRKALLDGRVKKSVTGKLTMEVANDKKMQTQLVINVELARGVSRNAQLGSNIRKAVVETLLRENSEYVSNYKAYGRQAWPRIVLWPHEHQLHFHGRGKQKWVKK